MRVIPFYDFTFMHQPIKGQMIQSFEKVYDSNWFVNGENVDFFQKEFATYCGAKHSVGVSNGLDALYLCLKSLGVGKGDEVIVPSNTYIATVIAITSVGATPVFSEPRQDTYNLCPAGVKQAITNKTKVIIPVHLYGQVCEMDTFNNLAKSNDLFIVEDNAQSHGASYKGKKSGSWGIINATSFYPGKNLGALGDAGAITTDSYELAEKVNVLKNYGSSEKYINKVVGGNHRLDEMQAALLRVKLKFLDDWNYQRQQIAELYNEQLSKISEDLILPVTANHSTHVYHQFVVRTTQRNLLQKYLKDRGVDTLIHYPIPPHLQKAYSYLGFAENSFPIAENLAQTSLSLPIYPGLTSDEISFICGAIRRFFRRY